MGSQQCRVGRCAVLMGLARVLQFGCALWLVGRVDI